MYRRLLLLLIGSIFLVGCTVLPSAPATEPCEAESFTLSDNFAGARRGKCVVLSANEVRITILPESSGKINNSPWYAFKVTPKQATDATITMNYVGGHHRYKPKKTYDGIHWQTIDDDSVTVSEDRSQAVIRFSVQDKPFWIAAQELLTPPIYDVWNNKMIADHELEKIELGTSRNGAAISLLNSNSSAKDILLLVGRQHPPEVTGAIGFFAFYEALMADTELAQEFRQRFYIAAIPMLNPDGVNGGNWRHNTDDTDLNRDWGTFVQPETRLVDDFLKQLEANDQHVRVFLDFHSTQDNVFYTQDDDSPTEPPHFTRNWMENSIPRVENYEFTYQENPTRNLGVAKNHMYTRYGIPSTTYEVGDETDRAAIRAAAVVFAEELMELMLEEF